MALPLAVPVLDLAIPQTVSRFALDLAAELRLYLPALLHELAALEVLVF